jgi:hypothetical protein
MLEMSFLDEVLRVWSKVIRVSHPVANNHVNELENCLCEVRWLAAKELVNNNT